MVSIAPFHGVLYDLHKIGNIKDVVTPPYDVISPEAQDFFYRRHPHNVIRLDLEKEFKDDSPTNNRYTRAAGYFKEWLGKKILVQDERPALYPYELSYSLIPPGQADSGPDHPHVPSKTLKGYFTAVRLEPFSTRRILPHENTFPKVKQDRLNLMRACRANFSPIFTLYLDPEDRIQGLLDQACSRIPPRIDFINDDETRHRMWSLNDPGLIQEIQELIQPKGLLIADGHHRYETALAFQQEFPQADRMLMFLVNMRNPGLSLLPIHRILHHFPAERSHQLTNELSRYFQIESGLPGLESLCRRMDEEGKKQPTLGLYTKKGNFQLLSLKPEGLQKAVSRQDMPPPLARLDVNLFDRLVLEDLLGLRGADDREMHIHYIKDPQEGITKVQREEAQMAFFLNPVGIEVVQNLAEQGIKMPHKSTYFYPKPLSGLVINSLAAPSGAGEE